MTCPTTLLEVLCQASRLYPSHELAFIGSFAGDSSIRVESFSSFNQRVRNLAYALLRLDKPYGSIFIVYLTEHRDNMAAIWACLLAGYVPCLCPPLGAQFSHRVAHVAHLRNLMPLSIWLTDEAGARQLRDIGDLEFHFFDEPEVTATHNEVSDCLSTILPRPDDDAILFLTSGSTGFSKVVVHTHRTILSACYSKGETYGLTSQSKILNWVGFDHVAGSLEMHVAPLFYGAPQLHVHHSVVLSDPLRFVRLLEGISIAFAPNFFLAKLVRDLESRTDLFGQFDFLSLKRINSGGEAIVSKTAQAFIATLRKLSHNPSELSFVFSPGFGMTETCAGCIYHIQDLSAVQPKYEFLELGSPVPGCEMRVVDPTDGITSRPDAEAGELQVRGSMIFDRYYSDPEATASSFVKGGWYRTGDMGVIENGVLRLCGRIKDTLIIHGVSYSISELETQLQAVGGVTHSALAVTPYRAANQDTEGFLVFYSPSFDFEEETASGQLLATHRALQDISLKMVALLPKLIIPVPPQQMEKSALGKLSKSRLIDLYERGELAMHISRAENLLGIARNNSYVAPVSKTERTLACMFGNIFCVEPSAISVKDNFFELGGTSIDVIKLMRECEIMFGISQIPTIQILKCPVLSALAAYIDFTCAKGCGHEEYDPIVPLQVSGSRTPIFMVHSGIGEVLVFVSLAKYFQEERPFYALRARGFDRDQTFFTSMHEMVSCYASAIKHTQRTGPYAIAGYSYGGVVAFEIAKYLEAQGDEIKFLGLVNIPPRIAGRLYEIDWTRGILNLAYFLGLVPRAEADALEPSLRPLTRSEQLDAVWNASCPTRLRELHLTPAKMSRWVDVGGSLVECGKGYEPVGAVAVMDVFYCTPLCGRKEDWLNKQLKDWKTFCRTEPSYHDVPGEHYTLLNASHVSHFQKLLRKRLVARGI